MDTKKYLLVALSVWTLHAQDISAHLRTGVNLNQTKMSIENLPSISAALPCPLPHITAEVEKYITPRFSIGLSGTYMPILVNSDCYHYSTNVAMNTYWQANASNSLGMSLHIQHVPIHTTDAISGFFSNLDFGFVLRSEISENIYSHFEIRQDITPRGLRSWELHPSCYNEVKLPLIANLMSLTNYTTSISVGYVLPQD